MTKLKVLRSLVEAKQTEQACTILEDRQQREHEQEALDNQQLKSDVERRLDKLFTRHPELAVAVNTHTHALIHAYESIAIEELEEDKAAAKASKASKLSKSTKSSKPVMTSKTAKKATPTGPAPVEKLAEQLARQPKHMPSSYAPDPGADSWIRKNLPPPPSDDDGDYVEAAPKRRRKNPAPPPP